MGRKCSHCGNIGHNSRTCTNNKASTTFVGGSLRLFGVQLDVYSSSSSYSSIISMKKSFSMDCLHSSSSPSSSPSSSMSSRNLAGLDETSHDKTSLGYLSDGLIARPQERKKGVPWTEEEHRTFLIGLDKLGKGDWRGISRNYVTTRTPTQVASHAQKYFLRQATINKKKRRSSLFDMVGSSNNMVVKSSPLNSSNFKPSDDYPIPNCAQPLIQTSVSENPKPDECSQIASSSSASHHHHHRHHHQHQHHHDYVPVWIRGLTNPQMNSNPNAANKQITTSSNAATTAPDLELKLAGPRSPNLEQNNKSSSGHLLAGPITVT